MTTTFSRKQLRDLRVTEATGINVGIAAGNAMVGGNNVNYAGTASFALTDNATNYVELDSTGTVVKNTSAFDPSSNLPLAEVVTSSGSITSITDRRPFMSQAGSGGGGGGGIWTLEEHLTPSAVSTISSSIVSSPSTAKKWMILFSLERVAGATENLNMRFNSLTSSVYDTQIKSQGSGGFATLTSQTSFFLISNWANGAHASGEIHIDNRKDSSGRIAVIAKNSTFGYQNMVEGRVDIDPDGDFDEFQIFNNTGTNTFTGDIWLYRFDG